MRIALALSCLVLIGCLRARARRAEEYLRLEQSFLVPYVDLDAEEREVLRVLGQRRLVVDETVRGADYVALSATTMDERLSAVRIITGRGVVAAEDGDLEDLFAPRKVSLRAFSLGNDARSEILLGVVETERGGDLGCAQYFRVRPDGQLSTVEVRLERFGSRACLSALARDADEVLVATVGWPSLSAGISPALRVDLRIDSGRIDQADLDRMTLRVSADEQRFIARESARVEARLARARDFAERHACAVARAALSFLSNESTARQLGAYSSALGTDAAHGVYVELIARTRAHIEHGWDETASESVGEASTPDPGAAAPATPEIQAPPELDDSVIVEPQAAP